MCSTSKVKTHKRKKRNGVSVVTEHVRRKKEGTKTSVEKIRQAYVKLMSAKKKKNHSNTVGREWAFAQS